MPQFDLPLTRLHRKNIFYYSPIRLTTFPFPVSWLPLFRITPNSRIIASLPIAVGIISRHLLHHFPYHDPLCSSEMMSLQSKTLPDQKLFFPNIISLKDPPKANFSPYQVYLLISSRDCSKTLVLSCPTAPLSIHFQEIAWYWSRK